MGMGTLQRAAQRLGLITRSQQTGPLPTIIPSARPAIGSDPLTLDAVYRAVSILQTAAMQLTIDVWSGRDQITPPAWINTPDPWRTQSEWLAETVASLALRGNAYWLVTRNPNEQITCLQVLDPLAVTISTRGQIREYHYGQHTYSRADLAHLALLRQPGNRMPYGLGPIQACQATIDGAARLKAYADGWMDQGTIPNGILTSDQELTPTAAAKLREKFLESVNSNEPMVLTHGMKYEPIMLTPDEIQWLDAQNFNVASIARMYGIPARLMLATIGGSSETYANQQQEELSFVRWTVQAYLREIEAVLTWLLPRGQTARFNLDGILRADTKTRYEAHEIAIRAGWLSTDEVRAIEGLTPRSNNE